MQVQKGGPLGSLVELFFDPGVQTELGLSEAKLREIKKAMNVIKDKFMPRVQAMQALPQSEKKEALGNFSSELQTEFDNTLATVMSPQQHARYRQIRLQSMGIRIFLDEEVQKALDLTGEQRSQIQAYVRESFMSVKAAPAGSSDASLPNAILDLLTAEQKATLDEVLGKRIVLTVRAEEETPAAAPKPAQHVARATEDTETHDPFRFETH
jgi:hypothetical protein